MHVFIFQVCGSDKDHINIKMISYVDKFWVGRSPGRPKLYVYSSSNSCSVRQSQRQQLSSRDEIHIWNFERKLREKRNSQGMMQGNNNLFSVRQQYVACRSKHYLVYKRTRVTKVNHLDFTGRLYYFKSCRYILLTNSEFFSSSGCGRKITCVVRTKNFLQSNNLKRNRRNNITMSIP